jgi:hypothetical protein
VKQAKGKMNKFVTLISSHTRLRQKPSAQGDRGVSTIIRPDAPLHHSDLSQLGIAKATRKRRLGLFSPEGVARARGFWLILLLLLCALVWAGIAWILLRALS